MDDTNLNRLRAQSVGRLGGALFVISLTVWTLTPMRAIAGEPLQTANTYSHNVLPESPDVLSWRTLGKVEIRREGAKLFPQFSPEIMQLNNQSVVVHGFIVPLEAAGMQSHFVLSAVPTTCSFCLPAGPEGMIEVTTASPIRWRTEPIVMAGKLAVLRDDPSGVLYRLLDARFIGLAEVATQRVGQ